MKKSERLNTIIYTIKERGRQSATDLAKLFEVTERTIYRDMDALSQMGVPITAFEGLGGGYEIDADYFIPSIKLNENERTLLLMLLKAGNAIHIPTMDRDYLVLKQKLLNSMDSRVESRMNTLMDKVHFYFDRLSPGVYEDEVMTSVLESLSNETNLLISYYHPKKDVIGDRKVSPVALFFDDGGWYMAAYCHLRHEKRTFRLDRIRKIFNLGETHSYSYEHIRSETDKFKETNYIVRMDKGLYRVLKDNDYMNGHKIREVGNEEQTSMIDVYITTSYKSAMIILAAMHPKDVHFKAPESFVNYLATMGQNLAYNYRNE